MRRWDGGWLAVTLEPGGARKVRRASLRALARLGLRAGPGGLWLRPDNLATCLADTRQHLALLGLEEGSEAFIARDFGELIERHLRTDLWPVNALQAGHEQALQALERSLERLPSLTRAAALVETYLLGGQAIRVLAADPLLPEEIMAGDPRRDLTERMLEYDAIGHCLWSEVASQPHLELVGGQHAG